MNKTIILTLLIFLTILAVYPTWRTVIPFESAKSNTMEEYYHDTRGVMNHSALSPYKQRYFLYLPAWIVYKTATGYNDDYYTHYVIMTIITLGMTVLCVVLFFELFKKYYEEWKIIVGIIFMLIIVRLAPYWTITDSLILFFYFLIFYFYKEYENDKNKYILLIIAVSFFTLFKEVFLLFIPSLFLLEIKNKKKYLSLLPLLSFFITRLLFGLGGNSALRTNQNIFQLPFLSLIIFTIVILIYNHKNFYAQNSVILILFIIPFATITEYRHFIPIIPVIIISLFNGGET